MSTAPFNPHAPLSYLTPGRPDRLLPPAASPIKGTLTGDASEGPRIDGAVPQGRVAFYDSPEQARSAVKMLVNSGFDSKHVFVLHRDKDESFDTLGTWVPVEPPTQDSATVFMATNGAGAGIVGGALLATMVAWPIAVVAAGVGALLGGAAGAMLGAGTFKSEETCQLVEQYYDRIAQGAVVVVVKPTEGEDPAKMDKAAELLANAAGTEAN